MSQGGPSSASGSGAPPVETLTGNSGGAVGPDGTFNIDVLGNNASGIDVVGTPASNLLTIVGEQASESQRGTVELADNTESITGTSTTLGINPSSLNAKLGDQTANGLIYGQGGAGTALGALAEATNGQIPIGNTGNPPVLATLTGGTGITITNGAGSITIDSDNNGDVVGPASATDLAIAKYDGTTGKLIQNSGVTIDASDVVSGATQLNVDNLRMDGNTLSSTDTNGAISIVPDGTGDINLTADSVVQSYSNVGSNVIYQCINTDNTNSASNAVLYAQAAGTGGDAFSRYVISGATNWVTGIDNSSSDSYKLSASSALGTTDTFVMTTAGERTMPLQPAFLAYLPSSDANAVGDATTYTLGGTTALTEVFDQNSDFNTNGTFTSPVTGRYCLGGQFFVTGGTAITGGNVNIVTSNRTYLGSPGGLAAAVARTSVVVNTTTFADMDAGDTATFTLVLTDTGGKIDDVAGNASLASYFRGFLVC